MKADACRVDEIVRQLKRQGNPDDAAHSQRFFKTGKGEYAEGDIFLGIRVPQLRKQIPLYRSLDNTELKKLLRSPFHEARLLALLLMVDQFKRAKPNQQQYLYQLYLDSTEHVNNWDLVDSSAHHIVGAYLQHKDKQPLYDLAVSDLLWERRIAMMACFYDIKRGEFSTALGIAEILLQDEHDLIHKAVGWMLREIGNTERSVEETFLQQHYHAMPRTMLRYAIEKFPEPLRQNYLKGRV
jgi:3-methyladenine DNA glycosylase AlkD